MQCPNCQHENKEGATFCEKCGAQLESEKKRLSFFERRQARERERIYLMSKASLQAEDVENIADYDMGEVTAKPIGEIKKILNKSVLVLVLSILGIAVCVAGIYVIGKLNFNDTLRVMLILILFLGCAVAGGYTIDYSYRVRMLNAMAKSNFAVKKLSYGKPPVMNIDGKCYELTLDAKCDIEGCGASMHIEEYNGEFIAVCDADRSHLRKLHCEVLRAQSTSDSVKTSEDNGEKTQSDVKEESEKVKDGLDTEQKGGENTSQNSEEENK